MTTKFFYPRLLKSDKFIFSIFNSKSDDFAKWDSLAQKRIILEIEKISKKKIKTSKISELNSIKAISEYLTK